MIPQIKLKLAIAFAFLISLQFSYSQEKEFLPKGFSEKEKAQLLVKGFQFKSTAKSAAPSGSVRTAAEWEEVEYLVLSWDERYSNILSQIVLASVEECKVLIAYDSGSPNYSSESSIKSDLGNYGISFPNSDIIFMSDNTDSVWIRDFAGNTIYTDDVGELGLVDWRYNRPRNNDNTVPSAHAREIGIPIYITDLVNTGGNFMSDGLGNAFASKLVLTDNDSYNDPYDDGDDFVATARDTEAEIDAVMSEYMGISSYYKMTKLPYDGIHHIDMHMKLLDEETILVSDYANDVADGVKIKENITQLLNDKVSVFGTPYQIEWIESPKDKNDYYPHQYSSSYRKYGSYCTYSNSVIVNKTVLLPIYSRPSENDAAIKKYEELMPGYNVVGINIETAGEDLIRSSGAIHCITHTIGVANPLLMVHQPVEEVNAGSPFGLTAMLKHKDGIKEAKIMWRVAGSQSVGSTVFPNNEIMNRVGSTNDFTATMPISASNSDIEYYIVATSNGADEKTLTRPLTAVKTNPADATEPIGFYTVKSNSTLSVDEWAENNISSPYPNPTYNNVTFKLNNIGSSVTVSIYNTLGQKLYINTINNGNGFIELNLNEAWKGPLLILFEGDFGKVSRKIMKL